jgi:hypothetical protein
VAINVSSMTTTPTGKAISLYAYNASGSQIGSASTTLNLPQLPAGDYTVLVQPQQAALASGQIKLIDATVTMFPDGTTHTFDGVPVQTGYFMFSATAGDDLGLALTGLTFTGSPTYARVYVDRPNGSLLLNTTCSVSSTPGCTWSLRNVPDTGEYRVRVTHDYGAAMSFSVTLTQDMTETLTPGTPLDLNLAAPGQQALLSFTATAGQTVPVTMSSIATVPTGKSVYMYVYNPGGAQIASTSSTTQATLNLTNLAAGAYTVLIVPQNAATASMQMQIP